MNTTALITREYQGHTFTFREDGYFNMTKAAQYFGKRMDNFFANEETRAYADALEAITGIPGNALIQAKRGGAPGNGGTWAHPKLAVFFARWLDVRFAVWCDLMVDEILRGLVEVQPVAAPLTQDRTVEDIVKALLPALLPEVRRIVEEAIPAQPQPALPSPVRQLLEVTRKVSIVAGARRLAHLAKDPVSDDRLTVREYLHEEGIGNLSKTTVGDIGGKARMLCLRLGIEVEERQGSKSPVGYYPREVISKAVELVLEERG